MKRHNPFVYLILAPQLVALAVVFGVPAIMLGRIAMAETDFIGWTWRGLGNFVDLVADAAFWKAAANTGLYVLMVVPVTVGGSLVVALMAYDMPRKMRSYLRVMLYLPTLTAGLIIATVWRWIWHPSAGLANWLLGLVGIEPVWWLGGRLSGIFAISCNIIVGGLGALTMFLMAAILSVPHELIDSARIDGASPRQVRWLILAPAIRPTIALVGTLCLLGVTQMWETVMMTTNGGPDYGTATVMFNIYDTGFLRGQFGYGSAKTLVLVALVIGLAVVKRKVESWKE